MTLERSLAVWLVLPSLAVGTLGGCGAYALSGSLLAGGVALLASVSGGVASAVLVRRSRQQAGARLRRPELRASEVQNGGIYECLLSEALELLERLEQQRDEAIRHKTELEARTRVRQKAARSFEAALNCLEQPVFVTDARGELQFSNSAGRRLLGVEDDKTSARHPDLSRVPELQRLLHETRTRNAATDHREGEFEAEMDGQPIAFRAVAHNVFERDETLLGVVAVLRDVREERAQKTRHAEFVSSVCHELKTPMAGIRAYIEMLMDGDVDDPGEQRELFGFIDAQVDRLTRLVNNMLNLARIESGVIKINRVDCELNEVLDKAAAVVQPTAEEKQIRIVSELSELYFPVHVDKDVFGQAVINLLSNSVKYTPAGGEVRLRSRMDEGRAVIEVRDTGMGIPEESLPHIFERFYRVPQNNQAAAGTGLGLALVHYIVTELHDGKIEVESVVNEGTCFTVTIPLGHVDGNRRRPKARKHEEPDAALCSA